MAGASKNLDFLQDWKHYISLKQNGQQIDFIVDKMAQVVIGITAVFNPQAIIINCSYLPDPDGFLELLKKRVIAYLPQKSERTLKLLKSRINNQSAIIGAAAAAISRSRFDFMLQETSPRLDNCDFIRQ